MVCRRMSTDFFVSNRIHIGMSLGWVDELTKHLTCFTLIFSDVYFIHDCFHPSTLCVYCNHVDEAHF